MAAWTEDMTIGFAHQAYRMQDAFEALKTGIRSFQVGSKQELAERIAKIPSWIEVSRQRAAEQP